MELWVRPTKNIKKCKKTTTKQGPSTMWKKNPLTFSSSTGRKFLFSGLWPMGVNKACWRDAKGTTWALYLMLLYLLMSHFLICCSLRPGILKLITINSSLCYNCSLAAKPMVNCRETLRQHWDVCCLCSWLHVLWDRHLCVTPNPLLVGKKHLPVGTYPTSLCFLDEEPRSGLWVWLSFVNIRSEVPCTEINIGQKHTVPMLIPCVTLGPLHGKAFNALFPLRTSNSWGPAVTGRWRDGQDRRQMSQTVPVLPPYLLTYKLQETKERNRNELEEQRKLHFC